MASKRILIFTPFGIGDVLFTTPLIKSLRLAFPSAYICFLCRASGRELMRNNPNLNDILIFEKDDWRRSWSASRIRFLKELAAFYRELKSRKFDILIDLSLSPQYGLFFAGLGIKQRICYDYRGRGRFHNRKLILARGYTGKHVARYYLELAFCLGIDVRDYPLELFLSPGAVTAAADLLKIAGVDPARGFVLVCPGSGDSWGVNAYFKRWPAENFVELCRKISATGRTVIIAGSSGEKQLCENIAARVPQAINLCARTSLEEFCAVLSLSALVISSDGGPFHAARALGKKTLVFFGPVDETVYGPYPDARDCSVLKAAVDCRPCYRGFKFPPCPYDKLCLRSITVDEAFSAATRLLNGKPH